MVKKIRSIKRALRILETLYDDKTRKTNFEISEKIGVPKSSTFRILATLVDEGYAEKDGRYYKRGSKLLKLHAIPVRFSSVKNAASPFLNQLNEDTGLTVTLALRDGARVIIYEIIQGRTSLVVNNEIGNSPPLYATGLGKAFLSFLSREERKRVIDNLNLSPYTKNTITKKARLRQEINQIRKKEYAHDNKEYVFGIECIAAPLISKRKDEKGIVKGSISVSGLDSQIEEKFDLYVKKVKNTSNLIQNNVTLL